MTLARLVALFVLGPAVAATPVHEVRIDALADATSRVEAARLEQLVATLAGFGTRHTASTTLSETRGIGAARRFLEADLRATSAAHGGRLEVHTQAFTRELETDWERRHGEVELVNVWALLPGRVGTRTFLISAHYDSINSDPFDEDRDAPGANDDASGTAVVLEAARTLAPFTFDANLVFLLVPGEEQGLHGSRHFAETLGELGLEVTAMMTNDIVGGSHGPEFEADHDHVRVFSGGDSASSGARELSRLITETAREHVPELTARQIFHLDRFYRGGDHIPFHNLDIPAVRFTEGRENYNRQHKHVIPEKHMGDLPEFTSPEYMAAVARLNVATLARLASAPPPPAEVALNGAMSHKTSLIWTAAAGVPGYEVLWRETTAAEWQHVRAVPGGAAGEILQVTIDETVDNAFWAVRAVSADGFSGLPTHPWHR